MSLTRKPLAVAIGLALFLLASAGCSSYGSTSSQTTTSAPASTSAATNEVDLYDYRFDPKSITLTQGKTVTLKVKNEGKAEHTFTIRDLGIDSTVKPGTTVDVTITPSQAGTFQLACKYHQGSGMVAQVTVK